MRVRAAAEGDQPPLDLLVQGQVVGGHGADDNVGVAGQELGRRLDDHVGAQLERPGAEGRRERVVDDEPGPDGVRASATAGISISRSCGLDSVSP